MLPVAVAPSQVPSLTAQQAFLALQLVVTVGARSHGKAGPLLQPLRHHVLVESPRLASCHSGSDHLLDLELTMMTVTAIITISRRRS